MKEITIVVPAHSDNTVALPKFASFSIGTDTLATLQDRCALISSNDLTQVRGARCPDSWLACKSLYVTGLDSCELVVTHTGVAYFAATILGQAHPLTTTPLHIDALQELFDTTRHEGVVYVQCDEQVARAALDEDDIPYD